MILRRLPSRQRALSKSSGVIILTLHYTIFKVMPMPSCYDVNDVNYHATTGLCYKTLCRTVTCYVPLMLRCKCRNFGGKNNRYAPMGLHQILLFIRFNGNSINLKHGLLFRFFAYHFLNSKQLVCFLVLKIFSQNKGFLTILAKCK